MKGEIKKEEQFFYTELRAWSPVAEDYAELWPTTEAVDSNKQAPYNVALSMINSKCAYKYPSFP